MKIYTKTGDAGKTGLLGNQRVLKSDKRVQAYGALDELNATLGWAFCQTSEDQAQVHAIQGELFQLGAELATPEKSQPMVSLVTLSSIERLEAEMDQMDEKLPELKRFILPGGGEKAARIHLARTICRRAERAAVELNEHSRVRREVLIYLNRLSDWLFLAARMANQDLKISDVEWTAPS